MPKLLISMQVFEARRCRTVCLLLDIFTALQILVRASFEAPILPVFAFMFILEDQTGLPFAFYRDLEGSHDRFLTDLKGLPRWTSSLDLS